MCLSTFLPDTFTDNSVKVDLQTELNIYVKGELTQNPNVKIVKTLKFESNMSSPVSHSRSRSNYKS